MMEWLKSSLEFLQTHSSTKFILDFGAAIYHNHSIVAFIALPFIAPPIKWILEKYVALTPWDDNKIVEQYDSRVEEIEKRLGMKHKKPEVSGFSGGKPFFKKEPK